MKDQVLSSVLVVFQILLKWKSKWQKEYTKLFHFNIIFHMHYVLTKICNSWKTDEAAYIPYEWENDTVNFKYDPWQFLRHGVSTLTLQGCLSIWCYLQVSNSIFSINFSWWARSLLQPQDKTMHCCNHLQLVAECLILMQLLFEALSSRPLLHPFQVLS